MGTRTVAITRHIESDRFWRRSFSSEEEAIEFKNTLPNRDCNRHELVGLMEEKRSGHRWYLCIKKPKKNWTREIMLFNSRKSCILAAKLFKDYDNDLIMTYTKVY